MTATATSVEEQTAPTRASTWRAFMGRHWLFGVFLLIGCGIRLLTVYTYRPAFMFYGDSFSYIVGAQRFQPPNDRPFGYSAVLRFFSNFGDIPTVIAAQHLVGIGLAVALYVVLLRRGSPAWIAALASAPLLLDAYLIQIEHNLLTESLFAALLTAAVFVATRERHTMVSAAVAGGLLAAAASTRTVAIPIALLFLGYLAVRRIGLRPLLAFGAALAVPILIYMTWFASVHGTFATTDASGRFLYGRVAVFADCRDLDLTRNEEKLCDYSDPALRSNANFYVWAGDSPLRSLALPGQEADKVASTFSRKVILNQPLTYARYVAVDTAHYFAPGRYLTRVDSPDTPWRFPLTPNNPTGSTSVAHNDLNGDPIETTVAPKPALLLNSYQNIVYTQGPLLLAFLLAGVAAGFLDRSRRRFDGPFAALVGLAVVAVPSLTVMFDYRYGLPAIPLLAYAGGIGATTIRAWLLSRRAGDDPDDPTPDQPDDAPPSDAALVDAAAEPAALVGAGGRVDATVANDSVADDAEPSRSRWPWRRIGLATLAVAVITFVAVSPMRLNPNFERYVSMRAELGTLGSPLGKVEADAEDSDYQVQRFMTGDIVARDTYATVVPMRYLDAIDDLGGYAELGMPTNRESQSPYRSADRYLPFEKGIVFWSRLDGTRAVTGRAFDVWNPRSVQEDLREPLEDARTNKAGDTVQRFAGGTLTIFKDGSLSIALDEDDDESSPRSTDRSEGASAAAGE